MALYACIQLALCFDRFQTIGLKQSGVYRLEFIVMSPKSPSSSAIPYSILSDASKFSLNNSSIDCETGTYRSKQFVLKGEIDEKINIKEVCCFRVMIRTEELDQHGGFELLCRLVTLTSEGPKQVDSVLLKTKKQSGISTYLPIYFPTFLYSSFADVTLHTQLISFRFCQLKSQIEQQKQNWKREEREKREGVMCGIGGEGSTGTIPQEVFYQSFEEYLGRMTANFDKKYLELFFMRHLEAIRVNFNQLKQRIMDMDAEQAAVQIQEALNEVTMRWKLIASGEFKELEKSEEYTEQKPEVEEEHKKQEEGEEKQKDREEEQSNHHQPEKTHQESKMQSSEQHKQLPPLLNSAPPSYSKFLVDLNDLSGLIFQLWNSFLKQRLYFLDTHQLKEYFMSDFEHFFKRFVFKNVADEQIDSIVQNGFKRPEYVIADLTMPKLNNLFLVDKGNVKETEDQEKSNDTDLSEICEELLEVTHVFVLVHGYSASGASLEYIRNSIRYFLPELELLLSRFNEEQTDDHIQQMGMRLAEEVKAFVSKRDLKNFKISFLGHSLGGIIIRAALPYLSCFKGRMTNLITIGSPHLGYLYHKSYIVRTGLWFLNKVQNQTSMLMLTMSDKPNLRDTYLYKLSHREGLEWFKNVTFVSSPDDSYVNESSALVMGDVEAIEDVRNSVDKGLVYREMIQNVAARLGNVARIRVLFEKLEAPLIDRIIGRTAHINYLVDHNFIDLLVLGCKKAFV